MNKTELQAFTNEIKDLSSSRAGINHYNYKDGRSFEKCYCIDCGKEIGWRPWYYGTKKCNSCVKKGRKLTVEHKAKLRQSLIPFKKGHKTNIGRLPWNKDIKYSWSEEARMRNKGSSYQFQTGELHPNWKGGVSSINELIRASDKLARWRTEVMQRDKYLCTQCGESHKLEVHHIVKISSLIREYNIITLISAYDCQELWDIDNGETRCYQCHKLTKYGQ